MNSHPKLNPSALSIDIDPRPHNRPDTVIILLDDGSTEPIQQTATATYASTKTSLNLYSSTNVANQAVIAFRFKGEFSFITFVVALLGPIFLLAFGKRFVRMTNSGRRRPDAR